jgi:hypothetical protein
VSNDGTIFDDDSRTYHEFNRYFNLAGVAYDDSGGLGVILDKLRRFSAEGCLPDGPRGPTAAEVLKLAEAAVAWWEAAAKEDAPEYNLKGAGWARGVAEFVRARPNGRFWVRTDNDEFLVSEIVQKFGPYEEIV